MGEYNQRPDESSEDWMERIWDTPIETASNRGGSFRIAEIRSPFGITSRELGP